MADMSVILNKLLERTNQNKIGWQTTADERIFVAVLGNSSVSISEEFDFIDVDTVHIFRILNDEGLEIERLSSDSSTNPTVIRWLQELYTKARRVALGVDSQLDKLLQELEADM